jgi:hypothetical protein
MKKCIALLLLLSFVATPLLASVGSHDALYVGGTLSSKVKEGTEGKVSADNEKMYVFTFKNGKVEIPYDRIEALEYGQKAGRRLGLALTISPWLLLSKKRKHYLTISWKDEQDKDQAAVLEMGKDIIRVQLATLEARSGRKVEYQDDEARKSGKGN